MEYIYKLKYKILEVFIKWLLRYYTMVFVIFGGVRSLLVCAAYWRTPVTGTPHQIQLYKGLKSVYSE